MRRAIRPFLVEVKTRDRKSDERQTSSSPAALPVRFKGSPFNRPEPGLSARAAADALFSKGQAKK